MIQVDKEIIDIHKRFQNEYNLDKVLKILDNPQDDLPTIAVVGTNGKGSTSFYLSKGLLNKYQKVGLFTSPAFLYHNERIQINNQCISDDDLIAYIDKTKKISSEYNLTFFEIWTLIAILYFKDKNVEIVVMEAGIGGIKDATSLMSNQVLTLLTSISFDHTEILGEKIEDIIYQKVNIAKPNTPIISSFDNLKYKDIIEDKMINNNQLFFAQQINDEIYYQKSNKGLVKAALEYLNISLSNIFQLKPPLGRYTVLNYKNHKIILDGAHNVDGINQLINSVNTKDITIVYAASENKDFATILKILNNNFSNVWITEFEHFKSWKISDINYAKKINNLEKFIAESECDLLVCGSLYFVPLVYELLTKML